MIDPGWHQNDTIPPNPPHVPAVTRTYGRWARFTVSPHQPLCGGRAGSRCGGERTGAAPAAAPIRDWYQGISVRVTGHARVATRHRPAAERSL